MKHFKIKLLCAVLAVLCLSGIGSCGKADETETDKSGVAVVDIFGNQTVLDENSRVVSCYGSFAECWMLAGGQLVGVTSDAVDEHGLEVGEGVEIVGSVKEIDLECLVTAEPDYVILSADLSAHLALEDQLKQLNIKYGYFRVDTFDDYKALMKQFCAVHGSDELYEKNVAKVEQNIASIISKIPDENDERVLLMRAFSTGAKAKTDDNLAGMILKEFGLLNIADKHPSLLEDLSIEYVVAEDPRFIFISTMGSEDAALAYIKENIESNPAWSEISAVKNGRVYLLPKELFHYKPNNRWDESYEYLARIIYPEIFE